MIKPGMKIGERYEIIDKVGSGGMADVYKAVCHKLNRNVAIKILKQEFSSDESFVDKFRAEAQSAAGLCHPNIVNVYDVGEENGIYYIVMELIEGITLKSFIERKGRLDIREATGIAIQIAQGLEAAHSNNLIHRDIKPQNIIISREGKFKVADFGIAHAASATTLTSSAMGSVHYISPEQARGGYSDEKSDIYSLGITIYEMILGRVPFEGDNAVSIALLHIQEEPRTLGELLPGIPISIDKIVQKCLQKKPERRYLSVVELIEDLKHSLIEPDVDFVVIPDVLNNSPTIALSPEDVNAIRNGALQSEMSNMAMMNNNMNDGMPQNMGYDGYNDGYTEQDMYNDSSNITNFNEFDDDYIDEEEQKVDNKLEKITIIGAVVIVIFIIGIIIAMFASDFGKDKKKETPEASPTAELPVDSTGIFIENVVGEKEEDAINILVGLGFSRENIKVNKFNVDGVEDGCVFGQDPMPSDTRVSLDQIITLNVQDSSAKKTETKKATIPSEIKGMKYDEAENKLRKVFNGLINIQPYPTEDKSDNPVGDGCVIKTDPQIGTQVEANSTIIVYYNQKPETVPVPNVIGESVERAKEIIKEKGLTYRTEYKENVSGSGGNEVVDQKPRSGYMSRNGEVIIYINPIKQVTTPEPTPESPVEETTDYHVTCTLHLDAVSGLMEALAEEDITGSEKCIRITARVGTKIYLNKIPRVVKGDKTEISFDFTVRKYKGPLDISDINIQYEAIGISIDSIPYNESTTDVNID